MPRRTDIHKILIIGSGPIVIGQACEFDYSGTQACKALRQEGYEVVLVNSNPATIMTDPEMADRTYIEPLTVESGSAIIKRERPDALLPTVGGQTALNLAIALSDAGVLDECGVEMIGAKREAIKIAEDRLLFKKAMDEAGLQMPRGGFATSWTEAEALVRETDYPAIIRPSFTLGGTGGGTAFNPEEYEEIVRSGLAASPIHEVLIEESILGWKEFELEVMRDLAVGYRLDEIPNDITKKTPASFEPTIDYVVTKIPKWNFEKFREAEDVLGTQMKSVGEVMAIGRTFKESLFKGLRSLEAVKPLRLEDISNDELQRKLARPNSQRFSYITYALEHGWPIDEIYRLSRIDPWFLDQLKQVMEIQEQIESVPSAVAVDSSAAERNESVPPAVASGLIVAEQNIPKLENIPLDLLRAFKE